jgi:hypothetical protein
VTPTKRRSRVEQAKKSWKLSIQLVSVERFIEGHKSPLPVSHELAAVIDVLSFLLIA